MLQNKKKILHIQTSKQRQRKTIYMVQKTLT